MDGRTIGLRVSITRYVDDHQPGFVACEFADIHGRVWCSPLTKLPYVTGEMLDEGSSYPRPGAVECVVLGRKRTEDGQEAVLVDIGAYISIEDVEQFDVPPASLVEWDRADEQQGNGRS